MLENLIFSFEMMGIGIIVVFALLLFLSLILMGFNKIFSADTKKKPEAAQKISQKSALGNKDRSQSMLEKSSMVKPIKGAVRPEVIAASMGALLFSLETQKKPLVTKSDGSSSAANIWLQTGRARVLNLRQDFVLLKRGKYR